MSKCIAQHRWIELPIKNGKRYKRCSKCGETKRIWY